MGRKTLTDEEKSQRRQTLLAAAHRLFQQRGDLPTVADIATAAGMAKGTVYIHFGSKEEIFIALLEDDFARLLEVLNDIVVALPSQATMAASQFARHYANTVRSLPDLLPLAALANGVLEQNLPDAVLHRFKLMLATGLVAAGTALEQRFYGLTAHSGTTLLLQTYALTLGLWQALNYPASLRHLFKDPLLQPLDRHFDAELEAAVCNLWLGSLPR